jgi:hypothetical protein
MGPLGNFDGPVPSGSNVQLVRSIALASNRDWRNSALLPLQIVGFTATMQNSTAQLNWQVENQQQVDKYLVQRSSDGISFETLTEIKATYANSASYSYDDNLADFTASYVYYRVVQVNKLDDRFYTRVISFNLNKVANEKISLYPNPIQDVLNIGISSLSKQIAEVVISDAAGKTLIKESFSLVKGRNVMQIYEVEKLSKGLLLVRVQTAEGMFTEKIIR